MTKQKSFVKEIDFTKEELLELIDLGLAFKELKKKRILVGLKVIFPEIKLICIRI